MKKSNTVSKCYSLHNIFTILCISGKWKQRLSRHMSQKLQSNLLGLNFNLQGVVICNTGIIYAQNASSSSLDPIPPSSPLHITKRSLIYDPVFTTSHTSMAFSLIRALYFSKCYRTIYYRKNLSIIGNLRNNKK